MTMTASETGDSGGRAGAVGRDDRHPRLSSNRRTACRGGSPRAPGGTDPVLGVSFVLPADHHLRGADDQLDAGDVDLLVPVERLADPPRQLLALRVRPGPGG